MTRVTVNEKRNNVDGRFSMMCAIGQGVSEKHPNWIEAWWDGYACFERPVFVLVVKLLLLVKQLKQADSIFLFATIFFRFNTNVYFNLQL